MAIRGKAAAPSPGAPPAPYVHAWVFVNHPAGSTSQPAAVSFMIDTGADRTVRSLRKARQLIGDANWPHICRGKPPVTLGGIGGAGTYWEVPMRLWFVDEPAMLPVSVERDVLVPPCSELLDLAEQAGEREGREPISLLGRDVFGAMRLEFDLAKPLPVILERTP